MHAAPEQPSRRPETGARGTIVLGIAILLGFAGLYWLLARSGLIDLIGDKAALRAAIDRLGIWGPVVLVALEAIAIVVSPVPSAPVALAAGAVYGTALGTVLVVIGAVLGAVAAFAIARCLGFEAIRRWAAAEKYLEILSQDHSQRWLMSAVFISRLLPFVSFDAVSYIAGMTPLAFWRFAVATLVGIVPASFLLAYAGENLIDTGADVVLAVIFVLVAVPFVVAAVRAMWRVGQSK